MTARGIDQNIVGGLLGLYGRLPYVPNRICTSSLKVSTNLSEGFVAGVGKRAPLWVKLATYIGSIVAR